MNTVNIRVMGQSIDLSVPEEESDLLQTAVNMLNRKTEVVRAQNNVIESHAIVTIAALNVIRDLLRLQDKDGFDVSAAENAVEGSLKLCREAQSFPGESRLTSEAGGGNLQKPQSGCAE